MGNSCFCGNIHFIKDVKLSVCFQKQEINNKSDQILIKEEKQNTSDKNKEKEEKEKNKSKNKMNELFNYFNDVEKEIMNNYKKGKVRKHISKKLMNALTNKEDNKYELMLKRLLEQQNIKKVGPKRRETIRKLGEEKIKDMVKNLLIENKNDILNKKKTKDKIDKNKNENENENNSLLIKKEFNKKGRFSVNIDRNALFMNNLNNSNIKKKVKRQYFNARNSISEVIGEINRSDYKQSSIESDKK